MRPDAVTACVATIPPRRRLRERLLASIAAQTHPPAAVSIAVDLTHAGAWATRQRALDAVRTPWTAFGDDDDYWKPEHLARLLWAQQRTHADVVFSWFEPVGMADPVGHFGKPFDPQHPHETTITLLVRTDLAQAVGFTPPPGPQAAAGEDARFIRGCVDRGAVIAHLPERTWYFTWHPLDPEGRNTHGFGDRW
jgi:hypothetical protein